MPVLEQDDPLAAGMGVEHFGRLFGERETGHDIGHDRQPVAEDLADRGFRLGQVGEREEGGGMGVVDKGVGQEGVQQGFHRRVRGAGIDEVGALHVDHVLVGQGIEPAHFQKRIEPHPGQARGFERVEIPTAALDVKHRLHDAKQVRTLDLDRRVATAMHDQIWIGADDPRRIDPERQRPVRWVRSRRIDPRLGFLVIPSVLPHYDLLPM